MDVIAVGYSGTGSSAIVHLLSEYSNARVAVKSSYEHVLFYVPDGLFDLEDRLLRNNSIHMSDGAIDKFYSAMKRLNDNDFGWFGGYKKKFGNRFMYIVDDFIEGLVEHVLPGYWSQDFVYRRSIESLFVDFGKKMLGRKVNKFGYKLDRAGDGVVKYSFVTPNTFYSLASKFVDSYLALFKSVDADYYIWDQLVLPQNLFRFSRYFSEAKVIVLDRDPRDLFVLSKYVWPKIAGSSQIFPVSVDEFTNFYQGLRSTERITESKRIMRMHFEELVYDYDDSVSKIENFLDINPSFHTLKKQIFRPEQSIKNTQNFRIEKDWEKEVEYIARNMKDSLFDFPYEVQNKLDDTTDP